VQTMVANGLFKIKPEATHVMQHAEYGLLSIFRWKWCCRTTSCWPPTLMVNRSRRIMAIPCAGVGQGPRREKSGNALFLEGRQVAAIPGIHAA